MPTKEDPSEKEEELDEVEDEDAGTSGDDGAEGEGDKSKPRNTERLMSALKKERIERRRLAKELKALRAESEKAAKKEQDEGDSDLEKLRREVAQFQDENAALKQGQRAQAIRHAVTLKASEMGFVKPFQAFKLLEAEALEELEVDEDDGSVEGVDDVLETLAKDNPHLLKPRDDVEEGSRWGKAPEIGAGKGGRVTRQSKDDAIRERIEKLRESGNYAG